jgi:hypothetical protein
VLRGGAIAARDVMAVVAHRVDEIVCDIATLHGRAHRCFVEDVAMHDFDVLETFVQAAGSRATQRTV